MTNKKKARSGGETASGQRPKPLREETTMTNLTGYPRQSDAERTMTLDVADIIGTPNADGSSYPIREGDFVFAWSMGDGPTIYSTDAFLDGFRRGLAGQRYQLATGEAIIFHAVWYVRSIDEDGVAHLENGSTYACEEYGWCAGHTIEGPLRLSSGSEHIEGVRIIPGLELLRIDVSRVVRDGRLIHDVCFEDPALGEFDDREMYRLADELERAASHIRRLAREQA